MLAGLALLGVPGAAVAGASGTTTPTREIRYGPAAGQTAYVYASPTAESPLVILVHGGGFTGGSATTSDVIKEARWLQEHDVTVVDVDYRLLTTDDLSLATEVSDVTEATEWARSHAAQYNADPAQTTLIGGSAGGTLVALAATRVHPRSVVLLSSINDLGAQVRAMLRTAVVARHVLAHSLDALLGCSELTACSSSSEAGASPVMSPDTDARWFVASSVGDVLVSSFQAREMADVLRARGAQVELDLTSGSAHAFELGSALNTTILSFITG